MGEATVPRDVLHIPLLPGRRSRPRPGKGGMVVAAVLGSIILVMCLVVAMVVMKKNNIYSGLMASESRTTTSFECSYDYPRGVVEGVSSKSNYHVINSNSCLSSHKFSYNWTNAMFSWQRTSYHFQPQNNWMNDPDAPLYHLGWYHLFYQYNPDSAVWGNITWGHAVSTDLIHWFYLPIALDRDKWYDINGVWTGSATILPNGTIIVLYTGDTDKKVQVQNFAYPANLFDPLLIDWVKYHNNPVLVPPPHIGPKDFRDPTTAWIGSDGKWRVAIGSKVNKTGIVLIYKTTDFVNFELNNHPLHSVPDTGMWECVDFYPVLINGSKGLDTSANGPGLKHLLKASIDDTKVDQYALGTYFAGNDTWVPDNPREDVGIGLRLDYGRYYASKTFYDPIQQRRILWGWVNETDTEADDLKKGWASIQTIPRTVVFDEKTGRDILQWPVEEIESLRLTKLEFEGLVIKPASVLPLDIGSATQLDIFAEFEIEWLGSQGNNGENSTVGCGSGAIDRSDFGPFGILALADDTLSELTPIYFRPSNASLANSTTFFCTDETRSSKALDVSKNIYGTNVPVLSDEKLSMRVLVDHSVIESFGQGGRRVITSRIYPTEAIYGAAKLFVFNNATDINVKVSLKIWQLNSAFIRPFPFDQIQRKL